MSNSVLLFHILEFDLIIPAPITHWLRLVFINRTVFGFFYRSNGWIIHALFSAESHTFIQNASAYIAHLRYHLAYTYILLHHCNNCKTILIKLTMLYKNWLFLCWYLLVRQDGFFPIRLLFLICEGFLLYLFLKLL